MKITIKKDNETITLSNCTYDEHLWYRGEGDQLELLETTELVSPWPIFDDIDLPEISVGSFITLKPFGAQGREQFQILGYECNH